MDYLRNGTRDQYESGWILILTGVTKDFTHGLSEIPWVVDLLFSFSSAGSMPKHAPFTPDSPFGITRDATKVSVLNASGENLYFQVRAM